MRKLILAILAILFIGMVIIIAIGYWHADKKERAKLKELLVEQDPTITCTYTWTPPAEQDTIQLMTGNEYGWDGSSASELQAKNASIEFEVDGPVRVLGTAVKSGEVSWSCASMGSKESDDKPVGGNSISCVDRAGNPVKAKLWIDHNVIGEVDGCEQVVVIGK